MSSYEESLFSNNESIVFDYFEKLGLTPPVVIGGVGGSGTRLVARLLREMNVQLGDKVNASEDALHFIALYDEFIPAYLINRVVDLKAFQIQLVSAIKEQRQAMSCGCWGWKNPRSIYILPLLDRLIPNLRYIHVIRHGFEMASSKNQNQLEKYQHYVLNETHNALPLELRALSLWGIVNQNTADYGLNFMKERYILLRYEDVCLNPMRAMQPIAEFLNLSLPGSWKEPIHLPDERSKVIPPERLNEMKDIGLTALTRFGYSC